MRLQHVDTKGYLHSHDKKYSHIVAGQQEVIASTYLSTLLVLLEFDCFGCPNFTFLFPMLLLYPLSRSRCLGTSVLVCVYQVG